jgi:O-antigen/teichoic acid export membrane protein
MTEIKNIKDAPSTEEERFLDSGPQKARPSARNDVAGGGGNLHLTSGRLLARNTIWNLAGNGAPLIVAVFSIPILIHGLGKDRFGVLTLAWALIGYASLFDIGLGRALTQLAAKKLGSGEDHEIPALAWTSLLLMLALGAAGTVAVLAISPWLTHHALKVPEGIQPEVLRAFYLLGLAVPAVVATAGLRGLLEAYQRFDLITALRIPTGVFTFVGPLMALPFSSSLVPVVGILAAGRYLGCMAHLLVCFKVIPELRQRVAWHESSVRPLLQFGGWVTASNVVNPILLSMDRFLIGSLLSVAMVGYYTAPFEAVTKLWMIPASLMTTVYPACSTLGTERMRELQTLYSRSIKYIFCALAPASLILVLFARPIIGAWLGPGFVEKSAVPLQFLAVGVFINCFAHVPYCFLQALGRPDTPAKLFVCELIPYGLLAWWMIERHGIAGAAAAWSIRVAIEVVLLLWIARRVFSLSAAHVVDRRMWTALGALFAMGTAIYTTDLFLRDAIVADASVCAVWMAGFAFVVWKWVLDGADRASARGAMRPLRSLIEKSFGSAEAD